MERILYFDNAATSFPKPHEVALEISRYLELVGGPYGRSAYPRALETSRVVERTRDALAGLFGTSKAEDIVFGPNATFALNTVLFGLLSAGDRVLVSPLEHNAVTRPLAALEKARGIRWDCLPCHPDGRIDPRRISEMLTDDVKLVVVNQLSNVNGVIQPLEEIKRAIGTVPLLVDASQSAGCLPIRLDDWSIDYMAFTGHKGLLGPTGTGGLFIRNAERLEPLVFGGTGTNSGRFEMPTDLPDRFEAGTGNIAGLFGLLAALENRPAPCHSIQDFRSLVSEFSLLPGLTVHASLDPAWQGEVVSLSHRDITCDSIGNELWSRFGIEVRVGLHCAPLAHTTLGTHPRGTVRIAPSVYQGTGEFEYLLGALRELCVS